MERSEREDLILKHLESLEKKVDYFLTHVNKLQQQAALTEQWRAIADARFKDFESRIRPLENVRSQLLAIAAIVSILGGSLAAAIFKFILV